MGVGRRSEGEGGGGESEELMRKNFEVFFEITSSFLSVLLPCRCTALSCCEE
jgi:hypothetical protein